MLLMPGDLMYGADPSVDGGQRVNLGRVTYPVVRTQKRLQYWAPQLYDNAFFCYGERTDLVDEFITAWCNTSYSRAKDASLFLLDRNGVFKRGFDDSDAIAKNMVDNGTVVYRDNTEHIADALDAITDVKNAVRTAMYSRRMVSAPNRRALIILIALSTEDALMVSDYAMMFNAVLGSSAERVYPVIVTPNAEHLPVESVQLSQFGVFLGGDNEEFALNTAFPDDDYVVSERNELEEVGLLQIKTLRTLEPISPLGKTFSEWYQQYTVEQESAYDEYTSLLSRLDDGS
jgi:hypothetical protein